MRHKYSQISVYIGVELLQYHCGHEQYCVDFSKKGRSGLEVRMRSFSYSYLYPRLSVVQVYQVIHEGVIKAAKKTNLARLGVGGKDVNRVFGRFVKELYILSQMHSDRYMPLRYDRL